MRMGAINDLAEKQGALLSLQMPQKWKIWKILSINPHAFSGKLDFVYIPLGCP